MRGPNAFVSGLKTVIGGDRYIDLVGPRQIAWDGDVLRRSAGEAGFYSNYRLAALLGIALGEQTKVERGRGTVAIERQLKPTAADRRTCALPDDIQVVAV